MRIVYDSLFNTLTQRKKVGNAHRNNFKHIYVGSFVSRHIH
jgi:hypothetical protein